MGSQNPKIKDVVYVIIEIKSYTFETSYIYIYENKNRKTLEHTQTSSK